MRKDNWKKNEDGIRSASSNTPRLLTICWMCGAEHKTDSSTPLNRDITEHKKWCVEVCRWTYERFNSTFREVYNVLELSLEPKKAEIAKDLIGNKLMATRNDIIKNAISHFQGNWGKITIPENVDYGNP